ncbi:MAG: HDOD domain-containing protein [Desulfobacterales bacterium]|nr:HDOD domain-containing protein [Desulfobacterales bacterium]
MRKAHEIVRKFRNVKTIPNVAIRLSGLMSSETCTIQDLEDVIRMDPTLVARLLRLINCPYYGLRQKVESLKRAIVFLGMKNIRNLVVIEALKDIFRENTSNEIFSKRNLWLHCAAAGICSQMIAERIFEQQSEDAFLCGILHDIGMIAENQVEHDQFIEVCRLYKPELKPITAYENEIIGTDHCMIGSLLAQEWKLPLEVQKGIEHHHKAINDVLPGSIVGIVQTSEYMVSKLEYTAIPGMKVMLSSSLSNHIQENIEEYKALARDLPGEISKANDLYESHEE